MRNLRIGMKLAAGFGVLLVIFAAVGFVSSGKLSDLSGEATSLSEQYVPSVRIAAEIERQSLNIVLKTEAFVQTGDPKHVEEATAHVASVRARLKEAADLAAKYPGLTTLKGNADVAAKGLDDFVSRFEATQTVLGKMDEEMRNADKTGKTFVRMSNNFLRTQYDTFITEVNEFKESEALIGRLDKIRMLNDAIQAVNDARILTYTGILSRKPAQLDRVQKIIGGIYPTLDALRKVTAQKANLDIIDEVEKAAKNYDLAIRNYKSTWAELVSLDVERAQSAGNVLAAARKVTDGGVARAGEIANFTVAEASGATKVIVGAIVFAILAGLLISFLITRVITRPLSNAVGLAERAGKGDLTISREDFNYDSRDEIGVLADALAAMVASQAEAVRQIMDTARELARGAESLAALSQETNASVEEIRGTVEEVSSLSESNSAAIQQTNAGIEEVASGTQSAAKTATDGASFGEGAGKMAREAVGQVDEVIGDIRKVGSRSEESAKKIGQLVASVEEISRFVTVITSIADQTNLLALNAAIEAARAGDAGRGFAVVADEVRKLAEESAKSAQEVARLITTLQTNSEQSITATQEAGSIMTSTTVKAEGAQKRLQESLAAIAGVVDSIHGLASVSEEQAASSEEMARSIDQVAKTTVRIAEMVDGVRSAVGETSKAADGVATEAQKIAEGAGRMETLLQKFTVDRKSGLVVAE